MSWENSLMNKLASDPNVPTEQALEQLEEMAEESYPTGFLPDWEDFQTWDKQLLLETDKAAYERWEKAEEAENWFQYNDWCLGQGGPNAEQGYTVPAYKYLVESEQH